MRRVAIANQKGGVGKTTTAVSLAHGLALAGRKVALLDLDPQANATLAVQGLLKRTQDVLVEAGDGLFVLPSPGADRNLAADEVLDVDGLERLTVQLVHDGFHYLIIDCPPRMDSWGLAGVRLAEEVLVPVQSEFFAMYGLTQMMRTLSDVERDHPGRSQLRSILVTMFDDRDGVAHEVVADLRRHLGDKVLASVILRDSVLVEAASYGLPIMAYAPASKAARCYLELVLEIKAQEAGVSRETEEMKHG